MAYARSRRPGISSRCKKREKYAHCRETQILDSVLQALSFRSNVRLIWNPVAQVCQYTNDSVAFARRLHAADAPPLLRRTGTSSHIQTTLAHTFRSTIYDTFTVQVPCPGAE
jgi:hypothetical protein